MDWKLIELHAKFARMFRIIAEARRMQGMDSLARAADKEARMHEAKLRDYATDCELAHTA